MSQTNTKNTPVSEVTKHIDLLVQKASAAAAEFLNFNQEQVDKIVHAMALKGVDKHMELAKEAFVETGRGVFEDKITKNLFASESVYHSIKYNRTVGIIHENEEEDFMEVAEPVGVIAAITPVTNPTSTVLFKSLISIKTRNPVIFAFHPGAQKSSTAAAKTMLEAAVQAGAPRDCIGWIEIPSIDATSYLMNHPGVATILATGGSSMVKAAYSTGKPALGVGPGNVPCYIEKTADIHRAVTDLILSKTFDNGMICASEQAVIVDRAVAEQVVELMKEYSCYFLRPQEAKALEKMTTCEESCSLNPDIVGRPAPVIAEMAGLTVPPETKILVAELNGVGPEYPLSREKLSPVLAFYVVDSYQEGITRSEEMIEFGGMGHSAVIHSRDNQVIKEFSDRVRVGRIIVNSPATHGAIGELYNTNIPSLTLGCGSMGHNATTSNVSAMNLINIKRVAKRRVKMQWFKVPERIFFEQGSVGYLSKMPGINRALIVCDQTMIDLGYTDKIMYHLHKRPGHINTEIFFEVEPDPSIETVLKGYNLMKQFKPDTIIALGGGSVIDAAKGMWLFYEHPEVEFEFLKLKFLDIRKRTYKYPKLGRKARLVAIPTTSGTGSEVTAFAVITDKGADVKYPLADYELTPDVAIVDVDFVMGLPAGVTADSGVDVLTHAVEAYVSVMASDYTDGLALKAIDLVFNYLPRAYQNGADLEAREKMHNASTIAGMAFTNAFLGINHSLAHKLGGEFHIPHGRANAVLLPYVIWYNAQRPTKFTSWPKYEHYVAHLKYQQIARYLNLPAATPEEGVVSLIRAINDLQIKLKMPLTLRDAGIKEKELTAKLDMLAEKAFEDQCTISNPRMPLISELKDLYRWSFYGSIDNSTIIKDTAPMAGTLSSAEPEFPEFHQ
ncbi:MAG: bifunctional acetaldehyde-CoA/alcohol dehydrogenase [Thermincola sp.]|jgi:acetaldehyde dehydrogenase/alcohol dehydrogenase|nr:bifunctional acetaldehyde-CoA/alcohol dehydrogenase [Thermincola sp.]MDT3703818.1 bifunctional acetaldehyde-CoA/alcohol dehydrogenase [Thermincola sp.]